MPDDKHERVWDIVENVGVCLMVTRFAEGLRVRPLEARPERDADTIRFVTDVRGAKDDEITAHPEVCLVFIDHKAKAYLSLSGHTVVTRDHARAAAIWRKTDDAWWSGPDDPNVRVVRFAPERAELLDGPASAAVAAFELAKARATGEKAQSRREPQGDRGDVRLVRARRRSLPAPDHVDCSMQANTVLGRIQRFVTMELSAILSVH